MESGQRPVIGMSELGLEIRPKYQHFVNDLNESASPLPAEGCVATAKKERSRPQAVVS